MQAFAFQPVRHESGLFRFECIKACLRHDLSRHVESARRNMKSKLAIKFPPSRAAKDVKFVKCSLRSKRFRGAKSKEEWVAGYVKCQGYARGGGDV